MNKFLFLFLMLFGSVFAFAQAPTNNCEAIGRIQQAPNGNYYACTALPNTWTQITISNPSTSTSVNSGSNIVACAASPGNTTGTYRQTLCQTTSGALYSCNNSAGCAVASDWVAVGASVAPNTYDAYGAAAAVAATLGTAATQPSSAFDAAGAAATAAAGKVNTPTATGLAYATSSNNNLGVATRQQALAATSQDPSNTSGLGSAALQMKAIHTGEISGIVLALPAALTPTGTVTNGSNVVTAVSSVTGLMNNLIISGTGIPTGTTIVSFTGSTITLSANATASGTAETLTIGSPTGLSQSQQSNNASLLQTAINLSCSADYELIWDDAVYPIYSSTGLSWAATSTGTATDQSCHWHGSQAAWVQQFYSTSPGAPVLTIGNTAGGSVMTYSVNIDGLRLSYGTSQTGNTNANAFVIGGVSGSRFNNIRIGGDGTSYTAGQVPYTNPAYRGVYFYPGCPPEFSNWFTNFWVQGVSYELVNLASMGTGSHFINWYTTNGYINQPGPVNSSTGAWNIASDGQAGDGEMDNINIESVASNYFVTINTWRGGTIRGMHFESIQPYGYGPRIFNSGTSRIAFHDVSITGIIMPSTTTNTFSAVTGNLTVYNGWQDDAVSFQTLTVMLQNSGNVVAAPVVLFGIGGEGDTEPSFEGDNIIIDDFVSGGLGTHVYLDSNMPIANFTGMTRVSHYRWGFAGSKASGVSRNVSATYTSYCQDEDSNINVPASITSFTLTLSGVQAASGTTSADSGTLAATTLACRMSDTLHVRRQSGTASGTLTVVDGVTSTTLTTSTTAATDYVYRFDGYRWRLSTDTTAPLQIGTTSTTAMAGNAAISSLSGTATNAQIPAPTTSALGGVEALSGQVTNQWLTYIDTSGVQHTSQPSVTAQQFLPFCAWNGYSNGAIPAWTPGTSNAPSGGTYCNNQQGSTYGTIGAVFPTGSTTYVYNQIPLSSTLVTGSTPITFVFHFYIGTANGNSTISVAAQCVASGGSVTPSSWTDNTASVATTGSADTYYTATITPTNLSSCAAGNLLMIRAGRETTGDTNTGGIYALGVAVRYAHY